MKHFSLQEERDLPEQLARRSGTSEFVGGLQEQAVALKGRGLSYEQVARKLGLERQRVRYLIQSADPEWVERRREATRKHYVENKERKLVNDKARRAKMAQHFGSYHAYREIRREAFMVAAKEGRSVTQVLEGWGILAVPGCRKPRLPLDLKGLVGRSTPSSTG